MAQNNENVYQVLWREINYIHNEKGVEKRILNDLSGSFRFGEMTAIMGPSGSGKTSLLKCIFNKRQNQSSPIYFNCNLDPIIAIIPQQNYFMPEFTVENVLSYASHLKNNTNDHKSGINRVIGELGLISCRNNRVTKCSGGELKRLAIAQELVSPTDILLLDEPTSGLDSLSCLGVIQILHNLSKSRDKPKAILLTIHQPSSQVFKLFDKIYAISSDGECVYEESPLKVVEILHKYGFECPQHYNSADYLIEVCYKDRVDIVGLIDDHKTQFSQLNRNELRVNNRRVNRSGCFARVSIERLRPLINSENENIEPNIQIIREEIDSRNSFQSMRHIWVLFLRAMHSISFNWIAIGLQIGTYTTSPIGISLLYNHNIGSAAGCPQMMANTNDYEMNMKNELIDIYNNLAFIFFSFLLFMMGGIMTTVLTFPTEMNVIMNETGNKWYKCWTYFIGRTLADCPFLILFPTIYSVISYHMTGQIHEFWRFSFFALIMIFVIFCAQSQGLIMGALFMNNTTAAVFISVTSTVPVMLFGGYFIKIVSMPEWGKYMSYISYFRFTFQSMVLTLYGFNRCKCNAMNTTITDCKSQILTEFNINDNDLYISFIWIITYFILIRIITYLIVKCKISTTN